VKRERKAVTRNPTGNPVERSWIRKGNREVPHIEQTRQSSFCRRLWVKLRHVRLALMSSCISQKIFAHSLQQLVGCLVRLKIRKRKSGASKRMSFATGRKARLSPGSVTNLSAIGESKRTIVKMHVIGRGTQLPPAAFAKEVWRI